MKQINIRLPAEVIEALRGQAESLGLQFSAHVRSQLAAISRKPHNIVTMTQKAVNA